MFQKITCTYQLPLAAFSYTIASVADDGHLSEFNTTASVT